MDYPKIKLTSVQAKRLRELNDRQVAVQQFVELVVAQAEKRGSDLVNETREAWSIIAAEYNLDLKHVNYVLDKDGETIIPVAVRLYDGG